MICGIVLAFAQEDVVGVVFVCLLVLAGALIMRWWAVWVAVGPLVALIYLEVSGYVGPEGEYADRPLLSPPGIGGLFWIALLLLLGVGLGNAGEWVLQNLKRRRAKKG